MKNKVLLIFPGPLGAIFPELPMSLLYLAWALQKVGCSVEILDMRLRDYREIKSVDDFLFVGVTSMTGPMIQDGLDAAAFFKSLNPDLPIVWGGIHVTMVPEQSVQHPLIDIVVRGEAELTVQELVKCLQGKGDFASVEGINYKKDGKVVSNPDRAFMELEMVDIELPYELFDMEKYDLEIFPLHTSRGCPYKCSYCYNLLYNKRRWRSQSAEKVLDAIEFVVKKFNVKHISFTYEDEFFINVKRVDVIARGIIERGIDIKWESFVHFNTFRTLTDEMLENVEKSGCTSLSFGGESGSQRMLDEVHDKSLKVDTMLKETKRLVAKTNIRQIVSFMSGAPTETQEELEMTYNMIDKLTELNPNVYVNGIFFYTPYPGTPLSDRIIKDYNHQYPNDMEGWAQYGIYRNVGNTWHSESYIRVCKTLSILTRFPFYMKSIDLAGIKMVAGGGRFSKFPFNIVYLILAKISIFRWKKRFFRFPLELIIVEKVLNKIRGFV